MDFLKPNPRVALHEVRFVEKPHIVKRGDTYLLRYQIAVERGQRPPLTMPLVSKKKKSKGYYYFAMAVSHPESGRRVERNLEEDGLVDLARHNAVYWLNPDKSEVLIEVRDDPARR